LVVVDVDVGQSEPVLDPLVMVSSSHSVVRRVMASSFHVTTKISFLCTFLSEYCIDEVPSF